MTDITLSPITSGYNVSKINANFDVVKEAINEHILHSDGGNNVMGQDIDMNSNRIYNLPAPIQGHEALRLQDLVAVDSGNAIQLQIDLADTTDPLKGVTKVGRATVTTDSVFSLLDVEPREDQAVVVKGYLPGSTIGGGEFRWNPVRVKSQHDGGTAISPTVPWDGTTGAALTAFLAGTGETSPGGAGCWERLGSNLDIVHFGATPTVSVNNFAPITKAVEVAFAKKVELKASPGTFEFGSTLDLSYPTLVLRGSGFRNTIFKFTGAGLAVRADGDRPNNGIFSFDIDLEDFTIEGNAAASTLLRMRIHHSRMKNINLREADSAVGVALRIEGVTMGVYDNITCSTNTQLMTNRPLRGLQITDDPVISARATDLVFNGLVIEGVMEDGVHLDKCDFATFNGGTSENNPGVGVVIADGCKSNTLIGMCFENSGFADVSDGGQFTKVINCYGTKQLHIDDTAQFHHTSGGFWNDVFEEAAAEFSTIENIWFNVLSGDPGTVVLGSTTYSVRNLFNAQTSQYLVPQKPRVFPVVPASGGVITNNTGVSVDVFAYGGTNVTWTVTRGGGVIGPLSGDQSFRLPAGATCSPTYTGAPTVVFVPVGAEFS